MQEVKALQEQDGVYAALGHMRIEEIASLYKRMDAAGREVTEGCFHGLVKDLNVKALPADVARAFRYVDTDAGGTLNFSEVVQVTQECDDDAMEYTEFRLQQLKETEDGITDERIHVEFKKAPRPSSPVYTYP